MSHRPVPQKPVGAAQQQGLGRSHGSVMLDTSSVLDHQPPVDFTKVVPLLELGMCFSCFWYLVPALVESGM